MKKINKNQKIIILVSTITIIIGIVIYINFVETSLGSKNYNSSNGNSNNGNLLPEYIKDGITIGGITGTLKDLDTFDATATAEDILEGKTAYVKGKKIVGTMKQPISKEDSYTGYYADVDNDGTPDGVIYADLAIGGKGQWANSWGEYEIPKESNLSDYKISTKNYNGPFGVKDVLISMENGNDRFYVMALSDFDSSEHYWYYYAYSRASLDDPITTNDFGKGLENTKNMINRWNNKKYGNQNSNDLWGIIQNKREGEEKSEVDKGWFVPSKSEWAVFASFVETIGLTKDNYEEFGLKPSYWASSQNDTYSVYNPSFRSMTIYRNRVDYARNVRLSIKF